jgi:hypothetical protein
MTDFLADLVLSILATFAVSRLLLWMTRRWSQSFVRLIAVHCAALILCVAAGIWGFAGSDTLRPVIAFAILFAPGELAWLLVDLFRLALRGRRLDQ